ncbi:DUF302 domain-containing protein [Legionella sp. W05-934-2]|uniref:DUF302 domain-containing protein n=1 Tax=Legionella sp. W05-934-2 TaxID=1198649 RepID=UPI0034618C88
MGKIQYGFGKTVDYGFDQALARVTEALKTEGFGVLTDIDVKQTLKTKLDKDVRPYRILGACNPHLAHRAIEQDPSIGLLLPCNVVIREDENNAVHIEFMNPEAIMEMVQNPEISEVAHDVKQRLERVLNIL